MVVGEVIGREPTYRLLWGLLAVEFPRILFFGWLIVDSQYKDELENLSKN